MPAPLRKLAQSVYWQNFFADCKEMGSLHLFKNKTKLTKIQIMFLHWLSIYNSLFQDIANEEDYISEDVVKDDLRCDAYLLWRRKCKDKTSKKKDNEENNNVSNLLGIPKIVFKSKRKK